MSLFNWANFHFPIAPPGGPTSPKQAAEERKLKYIDEMAGRAMQGILAGRAIAGQDCEVFAVDSYKMAVSMWRAREDLAEHLSAETSAEPKE